MRISPVVLIAVAALAGALGSWISSPSIAAAPTPTSIAVVDLHFALNATAAGQRAREEVETHLMEKQAALQRRAEGLTAAQDRLNHNAHMLSPEQRKEEETTLQAQFLSYQQSVVNAQQEAQEFEQHKTGKILEKLRTTAQGLARERGIGLVVEASSVVHKDSELDLTSELVQRFDAGK